MSIAIFLPVRKGSERVKEKNTRLFAGIEGGLLSHKINQLKEVEEVNEIIVSTNDEKCFEIVSKFQKIDTRIKLFDRPEKLGTSQTPLTDLIRYVPQITSTEVILWTHVTSPFCSAYEYSRAIKKYLKTQQHGYDSLISGYSFKEFLLDKNSSQIINNNNNNILWPRTQDLQDLFQINNAIFISSRKDYINGNRVGVHPFLMEFDKISSLDIDDQDDFVIAEAIYEKVYR